MRCKNCGWDNTIDVLRCEKCNMPLNGSVALNAQKPSSAPANNPASSEPISGTIKGAEINIPFLDTPSEAALIPIPSASSEGSNFLNCHGCQAPIRLGTSTCPYCKTELKEGSSSSNEAKKVNKEGDKEEYEGTIKRRQSAKKYTFSLAIIADEEETHLQNVKGQYEGKSIVLNRANLEPSNKTITSKEQALIENINGEWYISNKSELKSTFIRVDDDKPVKLEPGMVILLGDREFIFEG